MVDNPAYNGVMFMLFEEACRIKWDDMQISPYETRPAESRIFVKDFEASRGKLPYFNGNSDRMHQTFWPTYVDSWKNRTSPTIEHTKSEKSQSLFARVTKIILGLEEGNHILKPTAYLFYVI